MSSQIEAAPLSHIESARIEKQMALTRISLVPEKIPRPVTLEEKLALTSEFTAKVYK